VETWPKSVGATDCKELISLKLSPWKRWTLLVLLVMLLVCFVSQGIFGTAVFVPKKLAESTVAIVQSSHSHAADITFEDIRSMVRQAVDQAGGFQGLIKDGQVVVLKPNLVYHKDYTLPGWQGRLLPVDANGVTTDWRVTKAVVELVREYNPHGKVYVMEGSAVTTTREVMAALKYTQEFIPGVDEFIALEEDSGGWKDYNSPDLVKVTLPEGRYRKEFYLNKKYQQADVLISLPCLKNHWHAAVTGAIKNVGIGGTPANIYGISARNIGRNNMVDHNSQELHQWIHDFYMCRPVNFVIMDGLQGIQNGPTPCFDMSLTSELSRDQMNMRLILAGSDAVAVDTIEALLMGWDPLSVGYLKYLNEDRVGNLDPACINIVGPPVATVRKDFEGVIPPAGGAKVKDKTAPKLRLKKIQKQDNQLNLLLAADKETIKAEIFIDGRLYGPAITQGFNRITLDISKLSPGAHEATIRAYDRFLNQSEIKAQF
jgi:uncharacterized protein (DUF362 family)